MRHLWIVGVLAACNPVIIGNGDLQTEDRSLPVVTDLNFGGPFTVDLVSGSSDRANILCDSNLLQHIITDVEGDRLTLRVARGVSINPSAGCTIEVSVSTAPVAIDVSGAGDLTVELGLESLQTLDVSGAGNVVFPDDAGVCGLDVDISGSGDVDLGRIGGTECPLSLDLSGASTLTGEGTGSDLTFNLSGSGTVALAELTVKSADVTISGAGDGEITVTDTLKARISGAGDLTVFGNPTDRDVNTTGAGEVTYR